MIELTQIEVDLYVEKQNQFKKLDQLIKHKEMLQCIENGKTYIEMEQILFLNYRTTQLRMYKLQGIIGCKRKEVVRIAKQLKIITPMTDPVPLN